MVYSTFWSSLIASAFSGVFSIVIFWYSTKYLNDRYRNKIIRTLFKKQKVRLKNRQMKDIDLQFILSTANFLKVLYNFMFFVIVYFIFLSLLRINRSPTNFFVFTPLFFTYAALIYIAFILLLSGINIKFSSKKKRPNIAESLKYILVKSTYFTSFSFINGWIIFTYFFSLIYLENFRIINSYWEQYFLDYFIISFVFFLLPIIFIFFRLIAKEDEEYNDLAASIFRDFKQDVDTNIIIFIYTAGGLIKGKIIDIESELTLEDIELVGNVTIYVPWENIVFFKIIEP